MTAPLPPADLETRQLGLLAVDPGMVLHRFYTRHDAAGICTYEPIYFDRGDGGRFNAPDASFGMLYAALNIGGAFAETFLRNAGATVLPLDLLARKGMVRLAPRRRLRLVHLHGPALSWIGATAELAHGGLPYDVPQAWSAALRDHPARPDGIAYTARHDDAELCFAVFENISDPPLAEIDRIETLDADWFWTIAERYRVGLAP